MTAPHTETAAPSPSAHSAVQWLYRDALIGYAELLGSLAASLGEAAWRGQDRLARAHVGDMRLVLLEAIATTKQLENINTKAGGPP